jgi:lysophospholipase L1-like esterase
MNYRALWLLSIVGCLLAMNCAYAEEPTTSATQRKESGVLRLVIIGDSTVSEYPKEQVSRGWGQFIQEQFKDGTVQVTNLAMPGRSTKTFIEEGRWEKALEQKPDFVLIQFGHNDSHALTNPESTEAGTNYQEYLRRYIDDARAIQATPILITPMVRRTFDANGKITESQPSGRSLASYAAAMKEVAREKNVALVDLYSSSLDLVEKLGPAESATLGNKPTDATHFNEKGARAMADLVLQKLPTAEPRLAPHLKRAKGK